MRFLITLLLITGLSCLRAQETPVPCAIFHPDNSKKSTAFSLAEVDRRPQLLVCSNGHPNTASAERHPDHCLLEFIYCHFRFRSSACVVGTSVVTFIIESDGRIDRESIQCVRDIGAGIGAEIERLVRLVYDLDWRWSPAMKDGQPVPVRFNLPIRIRLE